MSGPLPADESFEDAEGEAARPVEVTPSRASRVGSMTVRRALPRRARRTVGPWCFADHIGPATVGSDDAGIGSHPHIGLQTVTWLVAGELRHLDGLGSDQVIRPGQLNLMTAGHGIAHAEEHTGAGDLHGIQLWIAQPERTRHGAPDFEHHAELPRTETGTATVTVLVGSFDGADSPARRDTEHVGLEVVLRPGTTALPVAPAHEHALVVLEGAVGIEGETVAPGQLGFVDAGRDELGLVATGPTRLLLLGGEPFESRVVMWWNFVARTHAEIDEAAGAWAAGDGRFADTGSALGRLAAPQRPWA